jgi:pimeloyl-ACP methyl ester carboxylesterase
MMRADVWNNFSFVKQDTWNGFKRGYLTVEGYSAWVVAPRQARPGNPWSWCLEFPDAFTERCAALRLLEEGFHHVYFDKHNNFGSPDTLREYNVFHQLLTAGGLAGKAVLIAISRGGLSAYRWASENPEKVAVIYGDAPVCDFKSWPAGKMSSKGNAGDWELCLRAYRFKDEAEALAYTGNPVDTLKPLARAGIPLIHVVGDDDVAVPVAENSAIVERRYKKLGGDIVVIHKPGVGHHPHGLEDQTPVIEYILRHVS